MFFKKKAAPAAVAQQRQEPSAVEQQQRVPAPVLAHPKTYFRGYVQVDMTTDGWSAIMTEEGLQNLMSLNLDELIIYLEATLNTHTITVDHNICNGVGPVSSSKGYLAFQVLLVKIANLIKTKRAEEKAFTKKESTNPDNGTPSIYRGLRLRDV